jgi:hypothetical protein
MDEAANEVTPALLARAIPLARVAPLSPVPAPEPPARATATAASTSGSDATTSVRRLRLSAAATCGTSFRDISFTPGVCAMSGGNDLHRRKRRCTAYCQVENLRPHFLAVFIFD